ncbi:metal ABC transporter substrate-binding protein [Clostridium sp. AM58-1XD]|uniref:metal ABC transporter substrate-binding protein n=1 Tax=Clostridium sp. AM58-1XD TaxID=2292307 RepID=UPI000E4DBC70|nr:metal ABC transporter substrate-binding protein [Clostridium sp. AM58-1XD]RGY96344.1 zinc ABC transporter substrate-binding protein [Clostridium sp. AM58-1XD]
MKIKSRKKSRIMAFTAGILLILTAAGCGNRIHGEYSDIDKEADAYRFESRAGEDENSRLSVVTTIFPYYDFIRQVAGERVELSMVVPAGMDSHSFEPTPADMRLIQEADLLICNGGAMEHWMGEALQAIDTSHMEVITMMDYVELFEEDHVEGMEEEEVHDHDGHEEEIEYDEHIWTSPRNAVIIVGKIRDALIAADPQGAEDYRKNAGSYIASLEKLDEEMKTVMKDRKRNMIILGDKFPFRYLAEEYGLDYRAAFSGCSTDTEPSARTIAYLIDKIKEKNIPAVYYLELSSHRVAEIISEETGAEPLLLHSCHNVTRIEFESGITYLQLMEGNVENLRKGLDE